MKFIDYLDKYNVNISALARKIGITPSFLCDVKMGRRIPNEAMQARIAEATNNQVQPKDWISEKSHQEIKEAGIKRRSKLLSGQV